MTYYAQELAAERRRSKRRFRLVAVVFAGLLAATAGKVFYFGGRLADWERERALRGVRRAAVRLVAYNRDGRSLGSGSGTIIDANGLILTNAHVAAPSAPGLNLRYGPRYPAEDPARLDVWTTPEDADESKLAYGQSLSSPTGGWTWPSYASRRTPQGSDCGSHPIYPR